MAHDKARVGVVTQSGKKYQIVLPINIAAGNLIPHLVRSLNLPTEGAGGAEMRYYLRLDTPEGGVQIGEDEMLSDAGVGNGSVLSVIPSMSAGVQGATR